MTGHHTDSAGPNGERIALEDMAETCARLAMIIECNQEVLVQTGFRRELHAPTMRDVRALRAAARTLDLAKEVEPAFRRLLRAIGGGGQRARR